MQSSLLVGGKLFALLETMKAAFGHSKWMKWTEALMQSMMPPISKTEMMKKGVEEGLGALKGRELLRASLEGGMVA